MQLLPRKTSGTFLGIPDSAKTTAKNKRNSANWMENVGITGMRRTVSIPNPEEVSRGTNSDWNDRGFLGYEYKRHNIMRKLVRRRALG